MWPASYLKQVGRAAVINARLGSYPIYRHGSTEAIKLMPDSQILEKTLNQVTLLGRVGSLPKRGGTDEHPFVMFSLATHNNYKYESGKYPGQIKIRKPMFPISGEVRQKTDWHRVCVFKPSLRELIMDYLKKGQRVHVTGKISYGSTKDDQTTKNLASIVAEEVIFFQSFPDGSGLNS